MVSESAQLLLVASWTYVDTWYLPPLPVGTVNFHDSLRGGETNPGLVAESIDAGGLKNGEVISGVLVRRRRPELSRLARLRSQA